MTRYQACRAIGLDPFSAAFVAFVHFLADAPEGKISIMHMDISYDPNKPYSKKESYSVREAE